MARSELDAINHGESDAANRGRAETAFAIGILGTVIAAAMFVLWFVVIRASRGASQ